MTADLASWLEYFRANARAESRVPWRLREALAPEERACIARSIAAFQLGESSDGAGLLRAAGELSRRQGSDPLVEITRLFIAEEQKHARLLEEFMRRHGIPTLRRQWSDRVFRRLRKNAGYHTAVSVLITAEIIALVYYEALRCCTGSKVLRAVCDEILRDEIAHVRYEAEMLRRIRAARSVPWRRGAAALHSILFAGAVVVVGIGHRSVLRRGGHSFSRFWRRCREHFVRHFTAAGELVVETSNRGTPGRSAAPAGLTATQPERRSGTRIEPGWG